MAKKTLLAVFAHPDDETFRSGGTLALLARVGWRVHVLTATHGEAGSCGEPPLCAPEELAGWRDRELRCACAALGVEPPQLLAYPDGGLADVEPERLVAEITTALRVTGAQVMLSFGPDGLSGHLDHVTVGRCAAEAFRYAEQVAALYTLAVPASVAEGLSMRQVRSVPDASIALTVNVSRAWEAKLAAIHCHASQLAVSPIVHAPPDHERRFLGVEHFVQAGSRAEHNDDLPDAPAAWLA